MTFETKSKNAKAAPALQKRFVLAASLAALCAGLCTPAFSADTETLIEKLHEKGVLSDEEYQEMRTEARAERRKEALESAKAAETKVQEQEAAPTRVLGQFKDGVTFQSGDRTASISLGGRVHVDYRAFEPGNVASDTFDLRRAYITVTGKYYDFITFDVTGDFANQVNNSALDVAWVNLAFKPWAQARFGQFKMPFSLEELTSSRFIDFQERSLVNSLVPQKERGAMLWGIPTTGVTYGLALSTGQGKNNNDAVSAKADNDVIGRATINFAELLKQQNAVLHVGAAFSDGTLPANFSLSQRTEARGVTFFNTQTFGGVDIERKRTGIETAMAWGPVKLQGEFVAVSFDGSGPGVSYDRDIEASYVEALWLVTGERYGDFYRNGAFGRISPNNKFTPGASGWGGFEIGLRYSEYDAADFTFANPSGTGQLAPQTSGTPTLVQPTNKADAWTLGLKWILNPNMKFYANYVETRFATPIVINPNYGGLPNETVSTERALTLRAAWDF